MDEIMSKLLLILAITLALPVNASFTVSTQNLWHYTNDYETRLKNLNDEYFSESADIMNFQEAWQSFTGKSLFNTIVKKEEFNTHYYRTNNTLIIKEGLATLSRFEILEKTAFELPHSKLFRKRTMIITKILSPTKKELYMINIHLSPFTQGKDERVDQLDYILKKIESDFNDAPVILTGDFNQEEDENFFTKLVDAGYTSTLPGICTYCANENEYVDSEYVSKLDYIFYPKEVFQLQRARRTFVEKPISDHFGIKAEFIDLRD